MSTLSVAAEAADDASRISALKPDEEQNAVPFGQPRSRWQQSSPDDINNSATTGHNLQIQLAQRPTLATARRLTVHDNSSTARPSLLTKQLAFKSSSAVPTLSTLAATSTAKSSKPLDVTAIRQRRASSGSGFALLSSRGSMTARDVSATDMLKQAISHR